MSESIFCEYCGKTLMQHKGEYDHGCLDCAGSIQSEKLFWLRKEVKELEARIKLQDQRIDNLLKAVEFYSNISTTMQTETALLVRDGFQGEFYPIQLKAAEALTRDKELMSGK